LTLTQSNPARDEDPISWDEGQSGQAGSRWRAGVLVGMKAAALCAVASVAGADAVADRVFFWWPFIVLGAYRSRNPRSHSALFAALARACPNGNDDKIIASLDNYFV